MPNKMLIDASHPEETRVVVVRGNRIEEFDFESQDKKQLKGNIYLARVTRVEPSLQAAFVEYGGNRHGFLAFSEIHPDYYQIPVADRQALLRAEAEAAGSDDDDEDSEERNGRSRRRRRGGRNRGKATEDQHASDENGDDAHGTDGADDDAHATDAENGDAVHEADGETAEASDPSDDAPRVIAEAVEADVVSEDAAPQSDADADTGEDNSPSETDESDGHDDESDDDHGNDHGDDDANGDNGDTDSHIVSVGAGDAHDEAQERRRPVRRHYKIQEVIKRRQILLVQVVKEERGNKGAALTTYLSLAGRYSVLMPNTARGGGISRKITNAQDRKRLKDVVKDLEVPQGMGVILRTAGESRTKAEIKRDYEYLMRLWDNVRTMTLQSSAPALVYEEGSLIKRSVRDLYNKDIDEILVSGDEGYREAKDFMRMLMPSHAKAVQPYREATPIFARNGIEAQLDKMLQPQVTLKSGGYIIINQTEALVAIDVNSGRSTKEHSIEDTALQTNLEAAEEVARQLRLRDLAGLIVIDFIDMEENRNNRAVEKRVKDCLKNDRARIQVGRISHFGLLEMSRQRIRTSVLESTMQPCPHCGGTGHIRSESSVALLVIRAIEEFLLKDSRHHISVRTPTSTALYMLNHKRSTLIDLENRFGLTITIEADESVRSQHYAIFKGAASERPEIVQPVAPQPIHDEIEDEVVDEEPIEEEEIEAAAPASAPASTDEDGENQRKRKRRRRRRGGRDRNGQQAAGEDGHDDATSEEHSDDASQDDADADDEAAAPVEDGSEEEIAAKKRRRGKRGGRRNRRDDDAAVASQDHEEDGGQADDAESEEQQPAAPVMEEPAPLEQADQAAMTAIEQTAETVTPSVEAEAATEPEAPKKKAVRRAPRKAKVVEPEVAEAVAALADDSGVEAAPVVPEEEAVKPKPKRASRAKKAVAAVADEATDAVVEEAKPVEDAGVEKGGTIAPTPAPAEEPAATPEPAAETVPAEPVITSTGTTEEQQQQDDKPRKVGWWQRKGFF